MRNYFGGLHQFPTNIAGRYRIAVIADVIISGQDSYLPHVDYFLGTASLRHVTDAIYLGPALSAAEAADWPQKPNLTTWCLNTPVGNHRDDLRTSPPGFAIVCPGYMMPVFLHHTTVTTTVAGHNMDAAVHLVGGLPHQGDRELPNGGYEISIGTFPFAAAIVELQLDDSGGLLREVEYWQRDNLPPGKWP